MGSCVRSLCEGVLRCLLEGLGYNLFFLWFYVIYAVCLGELQCVPVALLPLYPFAILLAIKVTETREWSTVHAFGRNARWVLSRPAECITGEVVVFLWVFVSSAAFVSALEGWLKTAYLLTVLGAAMQCSFMIGSPDPIGRGPGDRAVNTGSAQPLLTEANPVLLVRNGSHMEQVLLAADGTVNMSAIFRHPLGGRLTMTEYLMQCFFEECRAVGAELLEREADGDRRWLTRAELKEMMPQVLIGLPALVFMRMALRGAILQDEQGSETRLVLHSGEVLTWRDVSFFDKSRKVFEYMIKAQKALRSAGVRYHDLPVLEGRVLWEGDLGQVASFHTDDDVEKRRAPAAHAAEVRDMHPTLLTAEQGVIVKVDKDRQEAWVKWPTDGICVERTSLLVKAGADRPKPSEAQPLPETDRRMPKLVEAAGAVREVAILVSTRFKTRFKSEVIDHLVNGTQPQPQHAQSFVRTGSGGVSHARWHTNRLRTFGAAVEVGRARSLIAFLTRPGGHF